MTMIFKHPARMGIVTAALLALAACMMTPGKFTSSLDIRADRTFTFAYQGEVIVTDFDDLPKGLGSDNADTNAEDADDIVGAAASTDIAQHEEVMIESPDKPGDARAADATDTDATDADAPDSDEKIAKMQEIAEALMKEEGYRSVRYVGKNMFEIDYRITGRLDHGFIFPFNPDAQAVFPFLAIELRRDGRVRVQAPGFAENSDSQNAMGKGKGTKERNGVFTLTTNTEIISQNQEDGARKVPQGKQIIWNITPTTKTAPMAVLQLARGK